MALPTSPSVVVLENDVSIFAPNVDSSVVGIVGFADKGPTNVATLVTSQNNLLNTFGRPSSNIPGQALEGALEILEETNKVYFVRAVGEGAADASASIPLGYCPSVAVSAATSTLSSANIYYRVYNTAGTIDYSAIATITSGTSTTPKTALLTAFDPNTVGYSPIFAKEDTDGNLFLASRYAGSGNYLQVSAATTNGFFSFSAVDASGNYGTASSFDSTAVGNESPTSITRCLVRSIYPGAGYNLSSLRDGTVVGLSVEVENKAILDKFTVNSEGAQQEYFDISLAPLSSTSLSYILNTTTGRSQSDYVEAELLFLGVEFSDYIPNNIADKVTVDVAFTPRFLKLVGGAYSLAGGDSGYSTTETGTTADYTALIGTAAAKTGIYALDDDSLNISLALIPGITAQSVQNAFITLAETAQNFVAVVSPPYGLGTTQDAVEWNNGRGGNGRDSAINSSYAAVYWPWEQVFNYYAGADEWYDPAIFAARQYVYTDSVAEPWYAPAGYRRGRLTKPTNVEIALNQGDRDILYENAINPIIKESQGGILIFGQKTSMRTPSALNSVNVRRLLIYIRKVLLILGRPFQFEPNDEFTWELVEDAINPFLDDLKARRAITEGSVVCNSTTNTPLRVDRKEMWCAITIKPTLAAETVVFEINLTKQSATING